MTKIVVIGYASIDHVVQLNGPPAPNRTTIIASRPAKSWPQLGGSPPYIVGAMLRAGFKSAAIITWVGKDEQGSWYIQAMKEAGLPTDGVARTLPGRSPVCIMAYDPTGASYCLYEAGNSRGVTLDAGQLEVIHSADWICLCAQPETASRSALARLKPNQKLIWAVKGDPDAFPPDLRRDLAARADLIVHSLGERPFVEPALAEAGLGRPGRIIVETRGPEGAQITIGGKTTSVPTEKIAVADPTGAGDTFLGGLIASLIQKPDDPVGAIRAGETAARTMLRERASQSVEGAST
ncbi:MAG TPA: carbohydrate kinase family protein [Bradyrhizobium sp.]